MRQRAPLLLVASMLILGTAIEAVGFGAVGWLSKLPLALLLALSFWRSRDRTAVR